MIELNVLRVHGVDYFLDNLKIEMIGQIERALDAKYSGYDGGHKFTSIFNECRFLTKSELTRELFENEGKVMKLLGYMGLRYLGSEFYVGDYWNDKFERV